MSSSDGLGLVEKQNTQQMALNWWRSVQLLYGYQVAGFLIISLCLSHLYSHSLLYHTAKVGRFEKSHTLRSLCLDTVHDVRHQSPNRIDNNLEEAYRV
jgi:hypothetical protein